MTNGMPRINRNVVQAGISIVLFILLVLSFKPSLSLPYISPISSHNDYSRMLLEAIANGSFSTPILDYNPPLPFSRDHRIPPKIWQILLPHPTRPIDASSKAELLADTPSWLALNPGYSYMLVGQDEADSFISSHFSGDRRITNAWRNLTNLGVKSDLLRYLILFIQGGIYTDIDTEALQPIDSWIPEEFRETTNIVIGIEWDQLDGGPWVDISHKLQFCQWTIAAAPGHSLFMKMAYHTIDRLELLAAEHGTTRSLADLELSSVEVMTSSGPASWTDVVLEQLKEMDPNVKELTDFSGLKPTGPRLTGDILILTIDGFGFGQSHSNSTHDGSVPEAALLKHKFRGSWRGG
ncbi:hypothetical protein F4678DRAFT_482058 [Xylaria arbuscula]|nr:hypothetical protein F4678DRAFT_482058 [Xylaria arbuscula]